ncbi:MAG: EAL domain-containing response regulator [Holophagaceae bacterium]|nr:EAL domain-containing response regulator [Holophagaceae bacterium]
MDLSSYTVMVVEDHDFQRRMTLQMLKDMGAGVLLEAANGRAALSLLVDRGEPVDIIFCDLDMPEMDGVEFISHVAQDQLAQSIAVISAMEISILNTVETMAKAYGLQVLGTISKPFDLHELTRCVANFQPKGIALEASHAGAEFNVEDLKRGLKEREFLTFFQPKVSFATGEVEGVEALVRWFRPGYGVITPFHFIRQMELEGLVTPLTEVLLTQTCGYLKAWARRGHVMTASVNISMHCLEDVSIADRLHDLVKESGCDPKQIILEVTETEVMIDVAKVLNVLARLRLKGFGLSIDDFGTGYSSLQQLSNVPFTELKIDQSFVKDSPTQARHRTIIETSLDLAHKLKLKTVAEGVESRAEWDLLKSLECQQAQGYFVARPMPGHQIPEWIQMWQAPEEA